jgi:hypothetical protein
MRQWILRGLSAVAVLYLGFLAFIYAGMKQEPEVFAGMVAKLPMPAMMLFPFETFWRSARAGRLQVGDAAPTFPLIPARGGEAVTLASMWAERPLVLVFGSYT